MARNAFNGPFHTGNGRPGPFSGTHLCLSDSIIPLHRHFSALEVLQCVSTALLGYSNGQQWCLAKALTCILREVLLLETGARLQHHHVATVTLGQPPQRGLESRVTSGRALKAGGAQRFGATGAGRDLLELRPAEAALRWLPLAHEGLGGQGQGRGGGLRAIFAGSQGGG